MSQANMPLAHVIVAGRRSPCHLGGGGGGGGHKQQGFSSGVAVGGYAVAGLGMPLVPKPDRIIAEWHKPEHIAKVRHNDAKLLALPALLTSSMMTAGSTG